MVTVGKNGERTIKADDFFVDFLTTALEPGEILRQIRIPKPAGRLVTRIRKFVILLRFAVVGVAVALNLKADAPAKSGCWDHGRGCKSISSRKG